MTDKKKNILYIVCAYGFFWLVIMLIGATMTLNYYAHANFESAKAEMDRLTA